MSPFPTDVRAVDVYISFPQTNPSATTHRYRSVLKDADSQATERHPAEYMFKDIPPVITDDDDPVAVLLDQLDRHGIAVIESRSATLGDRSSSRRNTRIAFSRRNFGQTWSRNGTSGSSLKIRSSVSPDG